MVVIDAGNGGSAPNSARGRSDDDKSTGDLETGGGDDDLLF